VYEFCRTAHLSRRSLKKKFVEVQTRQATMNQNDGCGKTSGAFLHLVSSPELTLSICHFLGTSSSYDLACASQLSDEVVSSIMLYLKKLLTPRICVVGGRVGMRVLDAVQAFDPATGSWEILSPMHGGRNGCGSVVCRDHLYTIGGRNAQGKVTTDMQKYDFAKKRWFELPNLQSAREKFACVHIRGGIYIAGGWGGAAGSLAQADYFDPQTRKWSSLPPLPQPRYACGGATMQGCLFVAGGLGNVDQALNDVDVYDTRVGKWTSLPPMPTPRFDCAVAATGGRLFVIGGRNNLGQISDVVECFNPETRAWETLPPLVAPRFGCGASAVENKLYVFGGWDVDAVSRVEELDLSAEKLEWSSRLPPMPTARGGCYVTLLSR
jgi:hypothetical protein